ncbi:hypothetical protein IWQ61_001380 [Dispira simplex]|nr:hypothetical protein IWQ61_001380 [Dispira simplex]
MTGTLSVGQLSRRLLSHFAKAPKQVSRWELLRTLLAFVYLFVVAYVMVFFQQFSDRRWRQTDPKLRDLAFDWFPFVDRVDVADALVTSSLAIVVFGNLVLITNWRNRIVFVRRCLWLIGTLYFFRSFTLIVTTLPSPRNCVPPVGETVADMFLIGLKMIISETKACTDNIYSGHTVILVSSFLLWRIHTRHSLIIIYTLLHTIAGVILVLFTHLHYFVDILVAIFFTYAWFSLYFYALDLAVHKHYRLTPYQLRCNCQPMGPLGKRMLKSLIYIPPRQRQDSGVYHDTLPLSMPNNGRNSMLSHSASQWPNGVTIEEFQALAFTPRILNNGIPRLISWMDGLDLRIAETALDPSPYDACPLHYQKEISQLPMMTQVHPF